ncbi:MAG: DUF6338 family protein [bacterium]
MDFGLAKLLILLFPGVVAYIVSERIIIRQGSVAGKNYSSVIAIVAFSAWVYGVYIVVSNLLSATTLRNNSVPPFQSTPSSNSQSLLSIIADINELPWLILIAIAVGVIYAIVKNRDLDSIVLNRFRDRSWDRTSVWYEFLKSGDIWTSPKWVEVYFKDGRVLLGSINAAPTSIEEETMLLLQGVTSYRYVDEKKMIKLKNEVFDHVIVNVLSSDILYVAVKPGIKE